MDIAQLRCFLAVAEELHFGRAAERLHMTASPVSRIVKDLERELDAELFVRGYHQIQLTPAGRELALRVPPLLAEFDRLRSDIQLVAAGEERVVRLGGSHLSPPRILDTVVECVERGNPGRRVEVELAPSSELLPALSRGELDAAVVHLPVDEPVVQTLPLASYRFNIVMRRDDPLAGRPALAVADLSDRTVVTMPLSLQPRAMQQMRDELMSKGLGRLRSVAGPDSAMIAGHVRRTGDLALSLAPATGGSARVFDDPAFAIVPLTDGPRFHLGLAWLAARADDPVVSRTVTAVRAGWAEGETEI
ncbi:DNA-binding transcriptional LysR family regulator [Actinoplanes tereljensis]|uniref:Transcriptional regulator n=1 Tax=Paractinoplanes tereljensis TaxID=571912 RepID=A0A919NWV5_9ACTN|nr:LysR family transcriptional regulator [Actinoplanes tereljensis]GIF26710.1 transcriptional regulator [Actinoplanes tereljensis]